MSRLGWIGRVLIAVAIVWGLLWSPAPVLASHSMAGGAECGDLVIDNVSDMTKGRTDGMVANVDHRVGCKHLVLKTFAAAGRGEEYGTSGQRARCVEQARFEAGMTFEFYFDTKIDASSVDVRCSAYSGPD